MQINSKKYLAALALLSMISIASAHDTGVPHDEDDSTSKSSSETKLVPIKVGVVPDDSKNRSGSDDTKKYVEVKDSASVLVNTSTGNKDIDRQINALNEEFALKVKALIKEYQDRLKVIAPNQKINTPFPINAFMNTGAASSSISIKTSNGKSEKDDSQDNKSDKRYASSTASSTESSVNKVRNFFRGIVNMFNR